MYSLLKKAVLFVLLLNLKACASPEKKRNPDYDREIGPQIPISITSFKNKAAQSGNDRCHDWAWFESDLGSAFQELAIDELMNYKRFNVLERENIHQIYENEVDLVNSSKTAPIEKGQFIKAKYTISGVVNSFEYCAGRSALGAMATGLLSSSILGAGFNQESSTVEVTLRLIDTRTGKIIASKKGTGKQTKTMILGSAEMRGFGAGLGNYSKTSLSAAIQDAIQNSLQSLLLQAHI